MCKREASLLLFFDGDEEERRSRLREEERKERESGAPPSSIFSSTRKRPIASLSFSLPVFSLFVSSLAAMGVIMRRFTEQVREAEALSSLCLREESRRERGRATEGEHSLARSLSVDGSARSRRANGHLQSISPSSLNPLSLLVPLVHRLSKARACSRRRSSRPTMRATS